MPAGDRKVHVPMTARPYVVAGTGSRSLLTAPAETRMAARDVLTVELEAQRREHGDLVVMSGGAEGFDELVAVVALDLGLPLWLALPNRGYSAHYWGRNSATGRDRLPEFVRTAEQAWKVTYVMEEIHNVRGLYLDGVHSNFVRNDWMVTGKDDWPGADEFLVWNPTSKGTAHCLAGIKRAGKPYAILSPTDEPSGQLPTEVSAR